jgi:hypothetical protein
MTVEMRAIASRAAFVLAAPNAESPAAIVIAHPLNKNELVAMRAMAAWMNSRCFSLASILLTSYVSYASSFFRLSHVQL